MVHIDYRNVNVLELFDIVFVSILSYFTVHLHCLKGSHCDCIMSFICDSTQTL